MAAATLRGSKGAVTVDGVPGAVGCFPVKDGAYAYATAPLSSGAVLRVVADRGALTNARLATAGDAALGVRALGHHDRVVWLDAAHLEQLATFGGLTRSQGADERVLAQRGHEAAGAGALGSSNLAPALLAM